MKIAHVAGTRPNFIKLAAVWPKLKGEIFHTGQHWGEMSDPFLKGFPPVHPLSELEGDLAIVYGDCRSTLEGAIAAKLKGMKLAHVEAGLRCGDLTMPEEGNRIAVDHMSDYLFVTCQEAVSHLYREKVRGEIHFVGNVVMDSLTRYGVLTLHRPFNVDYNERFSCILGAVSASGVAFKWPIHPRVKAINLFPNIYSYPALTRDAFIELLRGACIVVTDSGGVQEEAAWLGRKCLTVRPSTERPITLSYGNELVDVEHLTEAIKRCVEIPQWDGKAAERIADILEKL